MTRNDVKVAAEKCVNLANDLGDSIIAMSKLEEQPHASVGVQVYEAIRRLEDVMHRVQYAAKELDKYTDESMDKIVQGNFGNGQSQEG